MPKIYPQDTPQKRNERKSFNILFPLIDPECWEYLGPDTNDHGVDHSFELIEENNYKGYRILSQVKSRTSPEIKNGNVVFDFPVKTANYAVGCSQPFFFFFVNLSDSTAFYISLQEFFIENHKKISSLEHNTSTVRVFIPVVNRVGDDKMKSLAKRQYAYTDSKGLWRTR